MAIIVNNPNGEDSGSGFVVGIVIVIILLVLFFVFGLPAIRDNSNDVNNNNYQPAPQRPVNTTNNYNSSTTVNVGATSTVR